MSVKRIIRKTLTKNQLKDVQIDMNFVMEINEFILLLRKGVYPYKYVDSRERFNEISLPDKKAFYSELKLEDITDKDFAHAQTVFKELKLKNLGDYHVQSDTLLLADVFGNF